MSTQAWKKKNEEKGEWMRELAASIRVRAHGGILTRVIRLMNKHKPPVERRESVYIYGREGCARARFEWIV